MEAFVRSHPFRAEQRIDALVCGAVQHMVRTGGTCSIQAVADALQVSMRQLQRRFRTATGLTPKEYASIRRARSALKRIAMGENLRIRCGWARLAADLGYADQAHLSREVARLLAFSPTQLSKWLDNISHSHLVD